MGRVQDLVGKRFGRLSVIRLEGVNKHRSALWLCRCDCGTEKVVDAQHLKDGRTHSCGCFRSESFKAGREALVASQTKHGRSRTKEHHTWQNIIYRCHTESSKHYKNYGGRGIEVCQRWRDSFEAFFEDMGLAPSSRHSLDRIDNDGPYSPENCHWATAKEQSVNRRDSRVLEYKGERKNLVDWATQFGLHKATLHGRLKKGWSVARSLETPPRGK